jgi:hypothetical protein
MPARSRSVRTGRAPDPQPELVSAAAELADAALKAEAEDLAGFALFVIQAQPSEETLATLATVIDTHRAARPWMDLATEQMARRIATRAVLDRLPTELADVVGGVRGDDWIGLSR